jgi:hypothetical protein
MINLDIQKGYVINNKYKSYFQKLHSSVRINRRNISVDEFKRSLENNERYGQEAEEFVFSFEEKRLNKNKEIEWLSRYVVNAGFDIVSYDNEMDITGFGSWTDIQWIAADINFVQGLTQFINNAKDPNYTDPYTGRKPSQQAVDFAKKAKTLFTGVVAFKKMKAADMLENLSITEEEYSDFINLIQEASGTTEDLPTPDNEQLPNN